MMTWHILTGEYPPQRGGVADYTRVLARGLAAAGDDVTVWTPLVDDAVPPRDRGVVVGRLPDHFGPLSLLALTRVLNEYGAPQRLLVQYVPHAFGWKAANLPFCLWLRSRTRDDVWVMFHEVAYPFGRGDTLARNAVAAANHVMARLVAKSASRAFVSIPGWAPKVRSMARASTRVDWLPVPSGIPVLHDAAATSEIRARHAGGAPLVGHFGTYGRHIAPILESTLIALARRSPSHVLLIGRRSDEFARTLIDAHPDLRDRVHGTGAMSDDDVSRHVAACDVMLQPYPDGVSSRRTSVMAALSHGRATVTASGLLTESIWDESGAVVLAPAGDADAMARATAELLADSMRRLELGRRAAALYAHRFDLSHTIAALRSDVRAA